MGGANLEVQYYLATNASKQVLKRVLFQLQKAPVGTEATNSYKNAIQIIMFMFFRFKDVETQYTTAKRKALEVVQCLAEIK